MRPDEALSNTTGSQRDLPPVRGRYPHVAESVGLVFPCIALVNQAGVPRSSLRNFDDHAVAHGCREVSYPITKGLQNVRLFKIVHGSPTCVDHLDPLGLHRIIVLSKVIHLSDQLGDIAVALLRQIFYFLFTLLLNTS